MTQRTFRLSDQQAFGELSGDFNPIHVDPRAARRLMFGHPVVHGVHLMLWVLDRWYEEHGETRPLRSVSALFPKPAVIDRPVGWRFGGFKGDQARLEVATGYLTAAKIKVTFDEQGDREGVSVEDRPFGHEEPTVLSLQEADGQEGTCKLWLDRTLSEKLLPALSTTLPADQIASILAVTHVVGMECPGMHSVLSEVKIAFDGDDSRPDVAYRTVSTDDRFSMVTMAVEAADMSATVRTFVRPPRMDQVGMDELTGVEPAEFAGRRALIIGGTRGLGEVTAKLLAAGGADVMITYRSGADDAERVVGEITQSGGSARSCEFDVTDPPLGDLAERLGDGWAPTHLYYYATPFIFEGVKGQFQAALFTRFCDCYVEGFYKSFDCVNALGPLVEVVYPSTVAVDELPLDMAEYAAAKSAGETICDLLAKRNPEIRFRRPRFGRLATDQTQTLATAASEAPLDVLPAILRED